MNTAPPVRRRLVGGALRRYRESLGLDLEDAAQVIGCDRSKISRVETGQRGIRDGELRELLAEYGMEEPVREALVAIARPRTRGWWHSLAATDGEFLALEATAHGIQVWEPQRIPDLLQTRDYARALAEADPGLTDDKPRQQAIETLAVRQQAILDERRTEVTVIIAETALRQPIGGPDVMRAQLAALAELADGGGHVTVHFLPSSCGAQAAATGPVTILRFTGALGLGVVYLPGPQGGTFLDEPIDLAAYTRAFGQLKAYALGAEASVRQLRDLAAR